MKYFLEKLENIGAILLYLKHGKQKPPKTEIKIETSKVKILILGNQFCLNFEDLRFEQNGSNFENGAMCSILRLKFDRNVKFGQKNSHFDVYNSKSELEKKNYDKIYCRKCDSDLEIEKIESVLAIPSMNWSDYTDLWSCHKESPNMLLKIEDNMLFVKRKSVLLNRTFIVCPLTANSKIFDVKLYNAKNPKLNSLSDLNLLPREFNGEIVSEINCKNCKSFLGLVVKKQYQKTILFKTQIKALNNIFDSYNNQNSLAANILSHSLDFNLNKLAIRNFRNPKESLKIYIISKIAKIAFGAIGSNEVVTPDFVDSVKLGYSSKKI
ncbi:hypothetical protein MHBO_005287 [Bonamia ostreae]|uniref:Uncharacterized protein n=1 Tax=Bonamia ostreae TaxID=126728 RepID=A0ABV2AJ95_9EUKA